MRGFLFAILIVILIAALGLGSVWMGFVNMRADAPPSKLESTFIGHAMDASVARSAPDVTNPITLTEPNLTAGARVYRDNCASCHGDPSRPRSPFGAAFNPPAPQFMFDTPDMPQNQNFYILQHGIRWTAMPAWKNLLTDQQMWQTVTFLSHIHELPSAALQVFTVSSPN
jgi:mono/diheme cytochrome c family protein